MADGNGKNVKVLSLVNCGMVAAVDIGVIRAQILGFLSAPVARRLRLGEGDLFMQAIGLAGRYPDDFVGEFPLGRRQRRGYQRNQLAKAQFNKSELVDLLDCSF